MGDTQHSHTQEELRSSIPEVTSDNLAVNETPISVDAARIGDSLLGCTEKDSSSSPPPNASAMQQETSAVKAHKNDRRPDPDEFVDPMYSINEADITFEYRVPEEIRLLDDYQAGYPRLAAVQNCDPNFSVYRKYGWLHNRVLLHLQAELRDLESSVQRLDKWQSERGYEKELRYDQIEKPKKKQLLAEARAKLAEYDDLLFRLQRKHTMKKPTRNNQNSVMHFVFPSLIGIDVDWICLTDDLVALADEADQSWVFQKILFWAQQYFPNLTNLAIKLLRTRAQRITGGRIPGLRLYSPARLEILARALLTVFATALVLAPLYALEILSRDRALAVYLSTLGFSAFCAVSAKASRSQVFAATGGYLALQVLAMILCSEEKILAGGLSP